MSLLYKLVILSLKKRFKSFQDDLDNLEDTQKSILKKITNKSYDDFTLSNQVTTYLDYKEKFEVERSKRDGVRWEPTSGSFGSRKWFPYTKDFLKELDNASNPWIYDLFNRYPEIIYGKQYWSLSWLPHSLRDESSNNDIDLVPGLKKFLIKKIMSNDDHVAYLETLDQSQIATILILISNKNTFISIWSPTFLIQLLKMLLLRKDEFISIVLNKNHPLSKYYTGNDGSLAELKKCNSIEEIAKIYFSKLRVISCWTSSNSQYWSAELKRIFSHVIIEGKGLWCTEGVITIPFSGKYLLSYKSHFYEFRDIETREILPSWKLKVGMRVNPVITTSSQIFRYEIFDELIVKGFVKSVPYFNLIGRMDGVDIAGEKMSQDWVRESFLKLKHFFPEIEPISLLAFPKSSSPGYTLLLKDNLNMDKREVTQIYENILLESYHYQLARKMNQISHVDVLFEKEPLEYYLNLPCSQDKISGDIKIEILRPVYE